MTNTARVMARVVKIDAITSIPKADAIECAHVGGWTVVVKRGEVAAGDMAVFAEVDSWIPHDLAPFLSKGREPRVYNGVKGEKLRTVRLRGQLSQGLLLPLTVLPDYPQPQFEGDDVSAVLGIQKWEAPIPACLAGMMRGNFPTAVPKTDQCRVQNLVAEVAAAVEQELQFEVTEKLEGSSCTMYLDTDNEFHVCSRNIDLKADDTNSFWRAAQLYNVEAKMCAAGLSGYAIQGELIGNKLNGNIYCLNDIDFYVYDIYNVNTGQYLSPAERRQIVHDLELKHVPVLDTSSKLGSVAELIAQADGQSKLYPTLREGIVFKQVDGGMTFKAISNQYLLAEK